MDGGLRKLFRQHIPTAMWVSIETGSTAAGVPDSFVCLPGGLTRWIEYKLATANSVDLSPFQVAWHAQYARHGGTSFIAVRRKRPTCDELHLYPGADTERLARDGLKKFPTPWIWTGGPARWGWLEILGIMGRSKSAHGSDDPVAGAARR